jgi:hypothetical protein
MSPMSVVMVLIGCSQNASQCESVATLPMAYASMSSCLAARSEILSVTSDLGYASVRAECRTAIPAASSKPVAHIQATS